MQLLPAALIQKHICCLSFWFCRALECKVSHSATKEEGNLQGICDEQSVRDIR